MYTQFLVMGEDKSIENRGYNAERKEQRGQNIHRVYGDVTYFHGNLIDVHGNYTVLLYALFSVVLVVHRSCLSPAKKYMFGVVKALCFVFALP